MGRERGQQDERHVLPAEAHRPEQHRSVSRAADSVFELIEQVLVGDGIGFGDEQRILDQCFGLDENGHPVGAVNPQGEQLRRQLGTQRVRHRLIPRLQHIHVLDARPRVQQRNQLSEVRLAHAHRLISGQGPCLGDPPPATDTPSP